MSENRNVTLSLPEPLLRKFRVHAATKNKSMSSLMVEAISKLVEDETEYGRDMNQFLSRLHNAPGDGPGDTITWKREDLYER